MEAGTARRRRLLGVGTAEPAPCCRRGDFVNCTNQPMAGVHFDGGYAESMAAIPSGLVSIPDELSSVDAAPLLCAGADDVQRSPALPGPTPVILWRCKASGAWDTWACSSPPTWDSASWRSPAAPKRRLWPSNLGAHEYIDTTAGDPAAALQSSVGGSGHPRYRSR